MKKATVNFSVGIPKACNFKVKYRTYFVDYRLNFVDDKINILVAVLFIWSMWRAYLRENKKKINIELATLSNQFDK